MSTRCQTFIKANGHLVLAFSNEKLAQTVANTSEGLEDMIYSVVLMERGEHGSSEDMPS